MDARKGFASLTLFSFVSLYVLLIWGAIDSERPRAPTISALIADDLRKLLLYGMFVLVFVISRTGLVFMSTFYDIPKPQRKHRWCPGFWAVVRDHRFAYVAAVFGSAQLAGFVLVALVNLNLYPVTHYAFAIMLCVCGFICELMLILRRYESGHVSHKWFGWFPDLALNVLIWIAMFVCLLTFACVTTVDWYAEITTYAGLAEWYGFMFMALINVYRQDDVWRPMEKRTEPSVIEDAQPLLGESSMRRRAVPASRYQSMFFNKNVVSL